MTGPRLAAVGLLLLVAGCQSGGPGRPAVLPEPLEPVAAAPTPRPTAAPQLVPTPTPAPLEQPAAAPAPSRRFVRVRVTTGRGALLPEPGRRYTCVAGDRTVVLRGPISAQGGSWALQAGAFADGTNARALAERLRRAGLRSRIEGEGERLRRVVVDPGPGEAEATLRSRLERVGVARAMLVAGAAGDVRVIGEGGAELAGAAVHLTPLDPDPVRVGAKRVRGDLVIRAGSEGPVAINVLDLETYLRGVVPAEMGPRAFGALEALKAQAVAARTYTFAHLDDHDAEGWDLCDTTSCQVYGGADAEHPLSDQAVAETEGEVALHAGRPIDAMYHSTCAGHTEDFENVFSGGAVPYLKGVACQCDRRLALSGPDEPGPWLDLVDRLAAVARAAAARLGVEARPAVLAARLAGAPDALGDPLDSLGVRAAVALHGGATDDAALRGVLRTFRLPLPPRSGEGGSWELARVVRLAQLAGALRSESGRLATGRGGPALRADSGAEIALPEGLLVLERSGEQARATALVVAAGSPATAWLLGSDCLAIEVEPLEQADARSSWTWWVRDVPLAEIASKTGIAGLTSVEVSARGISGRASQVRLRGAAGEKLLAAYPFRLRLGLPDTLFEVLVRRAPEGAVARFIGRGWGHGVGLCQNGAYGLALNGADYREILSRYYRGITIERIAVREGETDDERGRR